MPLYEYQCQSCEKRFEKIQKYSDPLEEVCPSCGGKVEKLVSSPAIQFKGSGFYITDYAKKSSSDTSSSKSSTDKKSDTSTSSDSSSSSSSQTTTTPSTSTTSNSKE
jgi:putative FmdB family regulatory protein